MPQIVWIEAPVHSNFSNNTDRIEFNKSLNTAAQFYPKVHVLGLKKIWDPDNVNLYHKESRCFTADGYQYYWSAIDKTVKYADTILVKKLAKHAEQPLNKENNFQTSKKLIHSDQFHWRRHGYTSSSTRRFKLPTPP